MSPLAPTACWRRENQRHGWSANTKNTTAFLPRKELDLLLALCDLVTSLRAVLIATAFALGRIVICCLIHALLDQSTFGAVAEGGRLKEGGEGEAGRTSQVAPPSCAHLPNRIDDPSLLQSSRSLDPGPARPFCSRNHTSN
jgi:hypothetical protein